MKKNGDIEQCKECKGKGTIGNDNCPPCHGTGVVCCEKVKDRK